VSCVKAGTEVALEGLCTSNVNSGDMVYYVDGVPSKKLVCPAPGKYRRLSVMQENINGVPCCSYRECCAARGRQGWRVGPGGKAQSRAAARGAAPAASARGRRAPTPLSSP
jgi:hypothetical protein